RAARSGQHVGDQRVADAFLVERTLVIPAEAGRDRRAIVRAPPVLRIPGIPLVAVVAALPARAERRLVADVDELDLVGLPVRVQVARRARRAGDRVLADIEDVLEADLQVVAAGLVRDEVGRLRDDLRLLAREVERVPGGAGHVRVVVDARG